MTQLSELIPEWGEYPNPRLAVERPILPYFDSSMPPIDPVASARVLELDNLIHDRFRELFPGSLFDEPDDITPITVLSPPNPSRYETVSFVWDNPDPEVIQEFTNRSAASYQALDTYYSLNLDQITSISPVHYSPQTGLPAFAPGIVPSFNPESLVDATLTARNFLDGNITLLLGLDLPNIEPILRSPIQLPQTVGIGGDSALIHVRYQQWYQNPDDVNVESWPVYGGQVVIHMGNIPNNRTQHLYTTSSYMPIPSQRRFTPVIDGDRAKAIAAQALSAYQTGLHRTVPVAELLEPWLTGTNGNTVATELGEQLTTFADLRIRALASTVEVENYLNTALPEINFDLDHSISTSIWNFTSPANLPFQMPKDEIPPDVDVRFSRLGDALIPWREHSAIRNILDNRPLYPSEIINVEPQEDIQPILRDFATYRGESISVLERIGETLIESQDYRRTHVFNSLLDTLWNVQDVTQPTEWDIQVAKIEGKETFILPFAGNYHLAYLVEFLSPKRDKGWRVFVDAEDKTGQVLGPPESLAMHNPAYYYFESSSKLLADGRTPQQVSAEELSKLRSDSNLLKVFNLLYHEDSVKNAISVNDLIDKHPVQPKDLEAMNVIYYAWKTLNHFLDIGLVTGIVPTNNQPRLSLLVGMGGDSLEMGLVPSKTDFSSTITFQSNAVDADGLKTDAGAVFTPSLDPEVVVHEVVHGLMWLMNTAPYDQRYDSIPFGRALLEGYATYLGRSLLERVDKASTCWAHAAYRIGENDSWGRRWDLHLSVDTPTDPSDSKSGGLVELSAPNYYPDLPTAGLPVYDVSMIWARALWDVRTALVDAEQQGLLESEDGKRYLGSDLADYFVIQSYYSVHGWSTNYEMAAEGLLASAEKIMEERKLPKQIRDVLLNDFIRLFARRGIQAQRGIQAVTQAGTGANVGWMIGTDHGLWTTDNPETDWNNWTVLKKSEDIPLTDVLAVTADDNDPNTVYIATETGIYRWNRQQASEEVVDLNSQTLAPERVVSLFTLSGELYAGTKRHIWRYRNSWTPWSAVQGEADLKGIAAKMVDLVLPNDDGDSLPILVVQTLNQLKWSQIAESAEWKNVVFVDQTGRSLTSEFQQKTLTGIERIDNQTLFLATLRHGVFGVDVELSGNGTNQSPLLMKGTVRSLPPGELGNNRILCLTSEGDQALIIGTTDGLFRCDLAADNQGWVRVPDSPQATAITAVVSTGQHLIVGTADNHVWIREQTGTDTFKVVSHILKS